MEEANVSGTTGAPVKTPVQREGERALTEYLTRFLLAIAFPRKDEPGFRSGIYGVMGGRHFVLTAAHYLEDGHLQEVYATSRVRQNYERDKHPTERPWWKDAHPGRRFRLPIRKFSLLPDPADLLIMEVDPLPDFEGYLKPYDLSRSQLEVPDTETPVFQLGYPAVNARIRQAAPDLIHMRLSLLTHATYVRRPETPPDNFDPQYHFLLFQNDRKRTDLQGMSGGPVWKIPQVKTTIWSPEVAELIGIQSGYYPGSKLLKVTQIKHAIDTIRKTEA